MNKFNNLHGEEPTDTPREWNSQPLASHFKSRTYSPKNSPVVSAIMGRMNHYAIDNGDVEGKPSEFPVELNYESVPDPSINPIKSIGDDEMNYILELFHS